MTRRVLAFASMMCVALGLVTAVSTTQAATAASSDPASVATYTLITGDRVAVSRLPDGRPTVSLLSDPSGARRFEVLTSGSHLYVLPQDAAGYIGQPLSLDLFEVTASTPEGAAATEPQDLSVEYTDPDARQLPPGWTASGPNTATVSDPKTFGAALAKQRAAAKSGTQADMFAGVARISRVQPTNPSPGPAAAGTTAGELHTVTVKAFDRRGRRAEDSTGVVTNVDDVESFFGVRGFFRGELAFSVPAGHYSISSYITTTYPDGTLDSTLVAEPDITVTHDTTVILDARAGRRVSATTPLASTQAYGELNYQRTSTSGVYVLDSYVALDGTPLYAKQTSTVEVGGMLFYPYFRLAAADGGQRNYVYDLQFPHPGAIPADLTEVVTQDQLATIRSRYHSPIPGRAQLGLRAGVSPEQAAVVFIAYPLVAPLERTEYVLARRDLSWLDAVTTDDQSLGGFTQGNLLSYEPGERTQATWMAQPMASGVEQQPLVGQACPACRIGDTLSTILVPFTDNDGHLTTPDAGTREHLTLHQDGVVVGESRSGIAQFALTPQPASYRLVYDVSEESPSRPTSTSVHTEWTFQSRERAADPLPPGWTCDGKSGDGGGRGLTADAGGAGCSFEPLLFARYRTNAGLDDVVPAGEQAIVDVSVNHQRGAVDAAITNVDAHVSYDDGQTWRPVTVSAQGENDFRLTYPQPPLSQTNGYASLRIHAADVDSNAIDQTIIRAYPLTVTPPAQLPTQPGSGDLPPCSTPVRAPYTQCFARVNTAAGISLDEPKGLGPADIQSAYRLSPTAGKGRTVAIVDAYDNPNAEADLAVYRKQYGLPPCTSADGCFRKVNQRGETTNLPSPDPGWGLEISLDLDAVSATCPQCRILLVEADSSSLGDLIPAVRTARRLGADAISNSYGSLGEFPGEEYLERYYRDLGVPFVVSTGDYGYGNGLPWIGSISYPAASQFAVAVGGTSLTRAENERGWIESAWEGATSGCSAYIHKPGWQKDDLCGMRTVADVAAVADPYTGLAVYDTFGFGGWLQVGGTSLAAPVIASIYAMADDAVTPLRYASGLYADPSVLYDVTGGTNGDDCSGTYLCSAVPGYDGPTGLGTPDGVGGFES